MKGWGIGDNNGDKIYNLAKARGGAKPDALGSAKHFSPCTNKDNIYIPGLQCGIIIRSAGLTTTACHL